MISPYTFLTALLLVSSATPAVVKRENGAPTAKVKNGTYHGVYNPTFDTDYFLGIPFAQPPVGSLRFRVPQPLNSTWNDSRPVTEYSPACIGYGRDTWSQGNYVSEDCLTLNVVRSRAAAAEGEKLPVVVWIHGGGLVMGSASDPRYNQSFIVQQSVEAGMPIVGVSINYRLAAWGFLYGKEVQESGSAMLGYRDQRLALHWIQENIAAFGGDPEQVTIQGESSGADSVAAQLLAYNGRDDGLFKGVIGQSGNIASLGFGGLPTVEDWEPVIQNISSAVGCGNASSVLDCLRATPTEVLNNVFNSSTTSGAGYGRLIDGDFVVAAPSVQLQEGNFVQVPYLIGGNSDEGTTFGQPVNTTSEFMSSIVAMGYDNTTAQDLARLYPDDPDLGLPATLPGRPNATLGLQYKRSSALATDMFITSGRRLSAQVWAENDVPVYTYRFNVLVNGLPYTLGSIHFQEVAFTFFNTEGYGYPENGGPNPMGGPEREKYVQLSKLMARMWVSFVSFGDPNRMLGVEAEEWPAWTLDSPMNFVFEQNVTSHAEPDDYRAGGVDYLVDLILARKGTNCPGLKACGAA